jgi:multidrug efflux pump subunit AcrB
MTVQFKVGVPRTEALVRLYDTVQSHADWLPANLGPAPAGQAQGHRRRAHRDLDAARRDADTGTFDLERIAHSLEADLKRVPGTREVTTLGGPGRAIRVELDPARMAAAGLGVNELRQALTSANTGAAGQLLAGDRAVDVQAGPSCTMPMSWVSWWSAPAMADRCTWPTWLRWSTARSPSATSGTARGMATFRP